ncbi:MAG: hypothetical protein ABIP02_04120, partial [Arenimonas sp.]
KIQLQKKVQADVMQELFVLFPRITNVTIARGISKSASKGSRLDPDVLSVTLWVAGKEEFDPELIKTWLSTKFPTLRVQINVRPANDDQKAESTSEIAGKVSKKSS